MPEALEDGALFERHYEVGDVVVDLLAEVEIDGTTLHLRDVAIFPSGTERASVGAAAVFRALRRELAPEVRSFGYDRLRITGTRLSGASPGHSVDLTISLTEEDQ